MEMPERTLAHAEHDANGFVFECVIERDITFVVLRICTENFRWWRDHNGNVTVIVVQLTERKIEKSSTRTSIIALIDNKRHVTIHRLRLLNCAKCSIKYVVYKGEINSSMIWDIRASIYRTIPRHTERFRLPSYFGCLHLWQSPNEWHIHKTVQTQCFC